MSRIGIALALALAGCGTVTVNGGGGGDHDAASGGDGGEGEPDGGGPQPRWIAVGSDFEIDLTGSPIKVGGYDGRVYYAIEGSSVAGEVRSRIRSLDVATGAAQEELPQAPKSNDLCNCGYGGELTGGPDGLYYVANYAQKYVPGEGWQTIDYPDPVRRGEAAAVFVDDHLWLMGGRGPLNTTVVLEPIFQQWNFGPDLPQATSGAAAVVVSDLGLLLFGGEATPHGIQHLDSAEGTWVSVDAPIPGDGGSFALAALAGERVYLHARGDSRLRVFDPFAVVWDPSITLPDGTVGVAEVGGSIYAVAAQAGEVDVYRLER